MALANAQITGTTQGAATTVYTSTNDSATTSIFLANSDSSARTVSIYLVPNGNSASDQNRIIKDLSIDAGDTYIMSTEKIVLSNGDTIQAHASVTNVVYANISFVSI
tara:strand:- start:2442 stop:2762 length:321 start_codon:yes stop_codon:yes gene_type:complete